MSRAALLLLAACICCMPVSRAGFSQERADFVPGPRAADIDGGSPAPVVEVDRNSPVFLGTRDIGTGDFAIGATVRVMIQGGSGAALKMGESYFGFDGPNREVFLSGALVGHRYVRIAAMDQHVQGPEWFDLAVVREGPEIRFFIGSQEVHRTRSLAAIGTPGFTFASVGGLAPVLGENVIHIARFSATGALQNAGAVRPRGYQIPTIDLASETHRQVMVDREPGQYLGHPTTVLLEDGKTMIAVYPKGHGAGAIVMKRSEDGGRTWSERLGVPENWATSREVPTLYRVVDKAGVERLIMFSGLYPIRMATSEDEGVTWTSLEPIGDFGGIVAMSDLVRTKGGDYLAFFHDDGRFIKGEDNTHGQFYVYSTRSADGGLSWSHPEVVVSHPTAHLCEPGIIRSPNGDQLLMLLRENSRQYNAFFSTSDDDGRTWSTPVELPGALTGDRHQAVYGPDGRLFVSFRDRTHDSPTWGDWVGWVGTYEDIIEGREGQYRVRLMDNHKAADTAYPGVEILPDGTIVTTTYGHWTEGEEPYIMSVRFTLEELDQKARAAKGNQRPDTLR